MINYADFAYYGYHTYTRVSISKEIKTSLFGQLFPSFPGFITLISQFCCRVRPLTRKYFTFYTPSPTLPGRYGVVDVKDESKLIQRSCVIESH